MYRRCEEDGCRKSANFGYPGGRRVRCGTHKLAHMVRAFLTEACVCGLHGVFLGCLTSALCRCT